MGTCRDCKNCTNSALAHTGRKWGRRSAAVLSLGASEMVMATQKKCRQCDHQMSLHGTDQVGDAVQPMVRVEYAPPTTPPTPTPASVPPGWYFPEGPDLPARWWDGNAWS